MLSLIPTPCKHGNSQHTYALFLAQAFSRRHPAARFTGLQGKRVKMVGTVSRSLPRRLQSGNEGSPVKNLAESKSLGKTPHHQTACEEKPWTGFVLSPAFIQGPPAMHSTFSTLRLRQCGHKSERSWILLH